MRHPIWPRPRPRPHSSLASLTSCWCCMSHSDFPSDKFKLRLLYSATELDMSPEMDTGHFFGPASNPTHLRMSDPRSDPTRLYKNAMCHVALYACKNNMKPLKHFIIAIPMFNTRRNRRIHISYKLWTQYTRYVVKVQSHESSRQTDTCMSLSVHSAVHQ